MINFTISYYGVFNTVMAFISSAGVAVFSTYATQVDTTSTLILSTLLIPPVTLYLRMAVYFSLSRMGQDMGGEPDKNDGRVFTTTLLAIIIILATMLTVGIISSENLEFFKGGANGEDSNTQIVILTPKTTLYSSTLILLCELMVAITLERCFPKLQLDRVLKNASYCQYKEGKRKFYFYLFTFTAVLAILIVAALGSGTFQV